MTRQSEINKSIGDRLDLPTGLDPDSFQEASHRIDYMRHYQSERYSGFISSIGGVEKLKEIHEKIFPNSYPKTGFTFQGFRNGQTGEITYEWSHADGTPLEPDVLNALSRARYGGQDGLKNMDHNVLVNNAGALLKATLHDIDAKHPITSDQDEFIRRLGGVDQAREAMNHFQEYGDTYTLKDEDISRGSDLEDKIMHFYGRESKQDGLVRKGFNTLEDVLNKPVSQSNYKSMMGKDSAIHDDFIKNLGGPDKARQLLQESRQPGWDPTMMDPQQRKAFAEYQTKFEQSIYRYYRDPPRPDFDKPSPSDEPIKINPEYLREMPDLDTPTPDHGSKNKEVHTGYKGVDSSLSKLDREDLLEKNSTPPSDTLTLLRTNSGQLCGLVDGTDCSGRFSQDVYKAALTQVSTYKI